jgi:hypothetical protein
MISPHASQSSNFPRQQPQQQQPGKVRRIKKSQSIHGLSNVRQYPVINPPQQQFQQQLNQLFYTPQPQLHRPYQPSYDDDFKFSSNNELDQFPMNVDLNFLNNFSLNDRVEGHQLL